MPASSGTDPERRAAAMRRRQRIDRWVPIRRWMREADAGSHRADVLAGLTVAAMLVPQGMAYAALAGMPPVTGLYASTVPLVVYALLGTSGQLAVGPVAIVSLLTASTLAPIAAGDPASYVALAGLLAAMVGAIQLALGLVRAGRLTTLLAHPVISGFTSAAAIVIATSQLDKLFGVSIGDADGWIERVTAIVGALGDTNPTTLTLGLVAIALLVGGKQLGSRVPTALIVVGLATLAVPLLDLQARGVATLGAVPAGFPLPQLPAAPVDAVVALLPGAVIIALLAYLEGISVARAIATRTGDRLDPDQELIASGAANLAASVIQAFPVAGGFSRTAVNHAAGARTPLATIVTAGGVLLALLLLAPVFTTLPQVVLAAVVLVAVIGLVDVREAVHAWKVERTDGMVLVVTFLTTLLIGVEIGIVIGIATSLAVSLWRVGRLRVTFVRRDPGTLEGHVEGDLLPASAVRLLDAVTAQLTEVTGVRHLVLDLTCVPSADGSGLASLVSVDEVCRAAGVELRLRGLTTGVRAPFERAGMATRFAGRITEAPLRRPADPRTDLTPTPS